MAKIKELKLQIKDELYKININCTTSGIFTAKLPEGIYGPLGLESDIRKRNLDDLEREIKDAFKRYINSTTEQELLIAIFFGASGEFLDFDGNYSIKKRFTIDTYFLKVKNVLGFDYCVVLKETVDGVVNYYYTANSYKPENIPEDYKFKKTNRFSNIDSYKYIPYSRDSVIQLSKIKNSISKASKILYEFMNLEPKELIESLNSQKAIL